MRKRSEHTRQQIVQAARNLFLRNGYTGSSVDAIAEAASVTKPTVYGYFPDKRALFAGVIEAAVGEPLEFHIPLEGIVTERGLHEALYAIAQGATHRSLRVVTGLLKTADLHEIAAIKQPEVAARMFIGGFVVPVLLDGLLHTTGGGIHKLTKAELTEYVDEFMRHITVIKDSKATQ